MMKKIFRIFIIAFCFLLKADLSFDKPSPKVMVVTSGSSVAIYKDAATSFMENMPFDPVVVDIGVSSKIKAKQIKNIIKEKNPALIYCIGSKALQAACKTSEKTPFIFSSVINWQRFNLPEKAMGVAAEMPVEMQLTLFRYIFPAIKRIGVIYNPTFNKEWFEKSKQAAESYGFVLVGKEHGKSDSLDKTISSLSPKVDSLWLIPDPVVITRKSVSLIFSRFENERKPVFAYSNAFIDEGAILAISVDNIVTGKQAALLALDILEDRQPQNKIQSPVGSFITLNLKKANDYDLEVNRSALGSINRIIE